MKRSNFTSSNKKKKGIEMSEIPFGTACKGTEPHFMWKSELIPVEHRLSDEEVWLRVYCSNVNHGYSDPSKGAERGLKSFKERFRK